VHYDSTRRLFGDEHALTQEAKRCLDEASKEALDKQPPAKKLAALRQEHARAVASLSYGLQRCDQIEAEMGALQAEYYAMEAACEERAEKEKELQRQIAEYELHLPPAAAPGAQRGLRDQLQDLLHAHVRQSGKDFSERRARAVCDRVEELLKDVGAEDKSDDEMRDDISDPAPSDGEVAERAAKQRREDDSNKKEEDDWERGLGAVGKKLFRRGVLGKRAVQLLEQNQAGQGGKSKGKGTKNKGKGPISYSAAVQTPTPPGHPAFSPSAGATAAGEATPSGTRLPGAALPPGGVPAGGNLTGGWPLLGGSSATGEAAAPATPMQAAAYQPVAAADYAAHQAQLLRGEGPT
jgi:hypothetical protein